MQNRIIFPPHIVCSLNAKHAGPHNSRSNARQTSGCHWKSLLLGAIGLWSQVVALALTRCVFYCFLIIARLLSGRIYWSRQAGRQPDCWLLMRQILPLPQQQRGGEMSVIFSGQCVGDSPSCFMHVRETGLIKAGEMNQGSALFSASSGPLCAAEMYLSGLQHIHILCSASVWLLH